MVFTRITINPNLMGGVPCIRGLRIPVAAVVGMLADGMTREEILYAFPDLEPEDLTPRLRRLAWRRSAPQAAPGRMTCL